MRKYDKHALKIDKHMRKYDKHVLKVDQHATLLYIYAQSHISYFPDIHILTRMRGITDTHA
jgi:hypothetical protein